MGQDNVKKELVEEDIIKKLMDLRIYLETRIRDVEEESEKLQALFKIVDEVIITKSFKKAETIPVIEPKVSPPPEFKEEIPLKTSTGVLLATIYVGEEEARIIPSRDLTFSVNNPPFQTFLIARILEPMKSKDNEDSQTGRFPPNQIFSYTVVTEGDIIKEFIIKNFRTRRRLREIVSSSRWTFEKMYEKVRTSGSTAP